MQSSVAEWLITSVEKVMFCFCVIVCEQGESKNVDEFLWFFWRGGMRD